MQSVTNLQQAAPRRRESSPALAAQAAGRQPTLSTSMTSSTSRPQICIPPSAGLVRPSLLRFAFRSSTGSAKEYGWGLDSPSFLSGSSSVIDLSDLSPVELEAGERSPVSEQKRRLFDDERLYPSKGRHSADPLHLAVAYVKRLVSPSGKAPKRLAPTPAELAIFCAFWFAFAVFITALSGRHLLSPAHSLSMADRAHDPYHLQMLGPHYISSQGAEATAIRTGTVTKRSTAAPAPKAQKLWTDVAREGGHTAPYVVYAEPLDNAYDAGKWDALMNDFLM